MNKWTLKSSTLSLLVMGGLISIMSVGGCPVAQTPTPQTPDDSTQPTPPTTPTPDNGLDRPIQPPDFNGGTTTSDSDGTTPTGSDTPDGGGGDGEPEDEPGFVMISINQPSDNIAMAVPPRVAQGAIINLQFNLIDVAGAVAKGELLLARDDDADGQPDGAPVHTQEIAILAGPNVWAFDSATVVQNGLLTNGYGRFVIGARTTTVSADVSETYSSATITFDAVAPEWTWNGAGPTQAGLDHEDHLVNRDTTWTVSLDSTDNSPHSWRVMVDLDLTAGNGNEFELVPETNLPADSGTRTPPNPPTLTIYPAGTYYYYVIVSDGIDPPEARYAPGVVPGSNSRLAITNRLITTADNPFDLNDLVDSSRGAILQGFNFGDLAGSSMTNVPDMDGDGSDELIIVSRFGKPFNQAKNNVGFGEAYLIFGQATRLRGELPLNSVGSGNIEGLLLPGIRAPFNLDSMDPNQSWTEGLSDVTVIPDMDGDELPEIVFSFPRVESLSLANQVDGVQVVMPDVDGMGTLEYDAYTTGTWQTNEAQFTRGGIVIVSSHNEILRDPDHTMLNRKGDRGVDLHEVGQIFEGWTHSANGYGMGRNPFTAPFLLDIDVMPSVTMCDGSETDYDDVILYWDVAFRFDGPGGFMNQWTNPPLDPNDGQPLANHSLFPFVGFPVNPGLFTACEENCEIENRWYPYPVFPGSNLIMNPSWQAPAVDPVTGLNYAVWTGFYFPRLQPTQATIGTRVLGQTVNDRFGSFVSSDGTWLYISAPDRTAKQNGNNVPSLPTATRAASGVVYQLRTDAHPRNVPMTQTQLWIEPITRAEYRETFEETEWFEMGWPVTDVEFTDAFGISRGGPPTWFELDWSMPVPHQYIIDEVGSIRGDFMWGDCDEDDRFSYYEDLTWGPTIAPEYRDITHGIQETTCGPPAAEQSCVDPSEYERQGGAPAWNAATYLPHEPGTAGYYMERVPQIVGPHDGAQITFVKALGDLNADGRRDFAVGSEHVKENVADGTGAEVGAIFIVYGRDTAVIDDFSDLLLERLALDPSDDERLHGVLLKGSSATGDRVARVFDDANDFNGDGISDVVVGNDQSTNPLSQAGEVVVIFGSETLESPAAGWTIEDVVDAGRGVRFVGDESGDLTGASVAGAGDVDGDGLADLLIAAPGAEGGRGAVYLVYGISDQKIQQNNYTFNLAEIGTVDLPGAKFVGRNVGDALGGGRLEFPNPNDDPSNPDVFLNPNGQPVTVFSDGIARLGDLDADGLGDFAISAMLADSNNGQTTNSGEVYVIYGRGD